MTCPNPDHERFRGVFGLPKGCGGCLACFAELQGTEIRRLGNRLKGAEADRAALFNVLWGMRDAFEEVGGFDGIVQLINKHAPEAIDGS